MTVLSVTEPASGYLPPSTDQAYHAQSPSAPMERYLSDIFDKSKYCCGLPTVMIFWYVVNTCITGVYNHYFVVERSLLWYWPKMGTVLQVKSNVSISLVRKCSAFLAIVLNFSECTFIFQFNGEKSNDATSVLLGSHVTHVPQNRASQDMFSCHTKRWSARAGHCQYVWAADYKFIVDIILKKLIGRAPPVYPFFFIRTMKRFKKYDGPYVMPFTHTLRCDIIIHEHVCVRFKGYMDRFHTGVCVWRASRMVHRKKDMHVLSAIYVVQAIKVYIRFTSSLVPEGVLCAQCVPHGGLKNSR